MAGMRCTACQVENRAGVRFCEECGTRLEAACPACGAPVPADKKFCGACGAPLAAGAAPAPGRFAGPQAYTPPHLAERILRDRSALSGERKQVTVLFADVSGFTSLSERLDPEEVHTLINRAFELMLAEIHRYEGTVNQFLGDGLMALFGAPLAHEDHARRAAHAALGVQRALAGYRDELQASRGIDFRVRLGLNTGLVVVGAIGDNLRMDYTAVGDTTNTAARMQQLAEPGQIVIADATERLIAPYFELSALGAVPVKGKNQPVAAWELRGDKGAVSRLPPPPAGRGPPPPPGGAAPGAPPPPTDRTGAAPARAAAKPGSRVASASSRPRNGESPRVSRAASRETAPLSPRSSQAATGWLLPFTGIAPSAASSKYGAISRWVASATTT